MIPHDFTPKVDFAAWTELSSGRIGRPEPEHRAILSSRGLTQREFDAATLFYFGEITADLAQGKQDRAMAYGAACAKAAAARPAPRRNPFVDAPDEVVVPAAPGAARPRAAQPRHAAPIAEVAVSPQQPVVVTPPPGAVPALVPAPARSPAPTFMSASARAPAPTLSSGTIPAQAPDAPARPAGATRRPMAISPQTLDIEAAMAALAAQGEAMPFSQRGSAPSPPPQRPPSSEAPRRASSQFTGTRDLSGIESPISRMPFAAASAAPASVRAPAPTSDAARAQSRALTLEQYASLSAELRRQPDARAATLARYLIDDERALHATWERHFMSDPALRERYRQLCDHYARWLSSENRQG